MVYDHPVCKPLGDLYLTVEFGDELSLALNVRVIALDAALTAHPVPGVTETIPTNRSLGIVYDPRVISRERLTNATGSAGTGKLALRADEAVERGPVPGVPRQDFPVSWQAEGGQFEVDLAVPAAKEWSEFSPVMFNLQAQLSGASEAKVVPFGFREISAQGPQLLLNGKKLFVRGTLECAIFPLTGHPPTDPRAWEHVFRAAKAHGLNLIRFHSWCPPEAAFHVADRMGFYFQVETCWPNQSTTIGDGKPVDKWDSDETESILKAYGNIRRRPCPARPRSCSRRATCPARCTKRWLLLRCGRST